MTTVPENFFDKFSAVNADLEQRLRDMTANQGTGKDVQIDKLRLLMEAGLSLDDARDFLYFVLFEPDENGVGVLL